MYEKLTSRLLQQSINQSIRISRLVLKLILTIFFVISCSKGEFVLLQDNQKSIVEQAKGYVTSNGISPIFFILPSDSHTISSVPNEFLQDWQNVFVLDADSLIYLEVPLYHEQYNEAIFGDESVLPISTRMILEHNKKTNKFRNFIITKILTGEITDIERCSFDDKTIDSYTIIYQNSGEIYSSYESLGGKLRPFLLEKSENILDDNNFIIGGRTYFFKRSISRLPPRTKSFSSCPKCGFEYDFGVCLNCHTFNIDGNSSAQFLFDGICYWVNELAIATADRSLYGEKYSETLHDFEIIYGQAFPYKRYEQQALDELSHKSILFQDKVIGSAFALFGKYILENKSAYASILGDLILRYDYLKEKCWNYNPIDVDFGFGSGGTPGSGVSPGGGSVNPGGGGGGGGIGSIQNSDEEVRTFVRANCPNMAKIFRIDGFLSVKKIYYWESAELAVARMKLCVLGVKVFETTPCIYDFREEQTKGHAIIHGTMIALPTSLLSQRNTDRLACSFFHELFHAKQIYSEYAKANMEIEAKIATYIFGRDTNMSDADINNGSIGVFHNLINDLVSCLDDHCRVQTPLIQYFNETILKVAMFIYNETNYLLDNTKSGDDNLLTLQSYYR